MDSLDDHEVVINLSLFKYSYLLNLLNPKSLKMFKYNVYHLVATLVSLSILCLIAFSIYSFVTMSYSNNNVINYLTTYIYLKIMFVLVKVSFIIYYSDTIWDLLNVTRINFLSSHKCAKHNAILHQYRNLSIDFVQCLQWLFHSGLNTNLNNVSHWIRISYWTVFFLFTLNF